MDSASATSMERDLSSGGYVKTCVDCGTSKTPLWRGGPAGPKSLCNACGIRSRKKRRANLGLNKGSLPEVKKKKKKIKKNVRERSKHDDETLKERSKLLTLGSEVSWRRSRSATSPTAVEKLRRKLGEVEQAAVLLMALSCGSVYG